MLVQVLLETNTKMELDVQKIHLRKSQCRGQRTEVVAVSNESFRPNAGLPTIKGNRKRKMIE